MSNKLISEIAKRILLDVGATASNNFGKAGITTPDLLSDKKIKIQYDDTDNEVKYHNIYSAKSILDELVIKCLLIDLSYNDMNEFLLLCNLSLYPTFIIRWNNYNDELSYIKTFNDEKQMFVDINVKMAASLLISFETIVSLGVLWGENNQYEELYNTAINII